VTRRLLAFVAPLLLALLPACSGKEKSQPEPIPASPPENVAANETAAAPEEAAPLSRSIVTLYFPAESGDTLTTETREIVDTKRPADRGAQIVAALLEGPHNPGALPAVPPGTTLRQLWVRDDGNAYVDFSEELLGGMTGGSSDEILTVYAIIDSLTANVPEIRKVGILVAGKERETFGHLDLRRPLPPNLKLAPQAAATE
jgi:spore germination protein GerM